MPVACACFLLTALIAAGIFGSIRVCAGHFGYPLDDTYIHMAMAKNFALHGVWGITRYGFSSSTSSPLFTLLLAGVYALSGVHELTSLVVNCISAGLVLVWCDYVLSRRALAVSWRVFVLCLLVLAIPLATLVLVGMEHVLHTLLTLIFVHLCSENLASGCENLTGGRQPSRFPLTLLLLVTALLVAARYEGVFLIGTAALLFVMRRMWTTAMGLAIACALPLAIYGWISVAHGWYPIPSSLLLKANLPSAQSTGMFGSFSYTLIVNITQGFHIVALVLLAAVLLYAARKRDGTVWTYSGVGLVLFMSTAVLHLCLARVGWFFRYESYLVALGIVVCAIAAAELGFQAIRTLGALIYVPAVLFAIPIAYREFHATFRTPQAMSDIYCQQYQMGLFARDNFSGKTIVLADIGAVSFLSDARVLDLIGLGSFESLQARIDKRFSTEWLDDWGRRNHAVAAMTALSPPPASWDLVAIWTIPGNYISGSDHVSIYSLEPEADRALVGMVARFSDRIPHRVVQTTPARAMASFSAGTVGPEGWIAGRR